MPEDRAYIAARIRASTQYERGPAFTRGIGKNYVVSWLV